MKLSIAKINFDYATTKHKQKNAALPEIKSAAFVLWEVYKQNNNFKMGLKMHELMISIKDSIDNDENQKAVIRQEYKFQYEKKAVADSIKTLEHKNLDEAKMEAERAQNKLKEQKDRQEKYMLFTGLGIAVLLGAFIFNRLRLSRKQERIIQSQKQEVETQKEKVDLAFLQL